LVEISDVEVVTAFAIVLIVVYVIGSYWKHKTLTWHAHWFEDRFSPMARVQFQSYGHAGLRVKCDMKDGSTGYRELHFAVSLGARENLMYFPLARLTDNLDRINCWGIVSQPIRANLVVISAKDKKRIEDAESRANMGVVDLREFEGSDYLVYSSDRDYATRFLSRTGISRRLRELGEVELLELDSLSSIVRTMWRLKPDRLKEMTDFVLTLGRAV
jgi:hypothetical protein